jgi:LPS sulfotransferase NodH
MGCLGRPTEHLLFLERKPERLGERGKRLKALPLAEAVADITKVESRKAADDEIFGVKIMWSTAHRVVRHVGEDAERFLQLFDDPHLIVYRRRDKVAQAVSQVLLSKTNRAHARSAEELQDVAAMRDRVDVTDDEISSHIQRIETHEANWQRYLAGKKSTSWYYEDFVEDPAGYIGELAATLGVVIDGQEIERRLSRVRLLKATTDRQNQIARSFRARSERPR